MGRPIPVWDEGSIASREEEYQECDLLLVPSRFVFDSFVAQGVAPSKIALAPYGVDINEYRPLPKTDEVFRILFVGALSLRKGIHYLLDVVSHLRWPNAELAIRGNETPEWQELLRGYRGTIPISMIPPQPRAHMKAIYSNASVLVLPSIEDAFGLVVGQALACGTPVIATTHTGGPDVIDDGVNGFIIPPADPLALEHALTKAYEDRTSLSAMGIAARERVERTGGWDDYGARVIAAFEQALRRRAQEQRPVAV
jgi:glycosyltransferase involved in cell wall biosynthesis